MWIYLNDAFLSIVKPQGNDPGVLLVRARDRRDLDLFPEAEIISTPMRDYAFRAFVPAQRVAEVVAKRILEINYDNFKASVSPQDSRREVTYHRIWSATRSLQYNEHHDD